jgi:hypothetical protein
MQNHDENLIAKIDGVVQPLQGVSVAVTASNGLPATIYSDDGVTVQANPMTTDANGFFNFYAANGRYTLTFTGERIAMFTRSIELYDADDAQPLTLAQAASPSGASLIGVGNKTVENALTTYAVKTAAYTAAAGDKLLCDTTGGPFAITLPAEPFIGTAVTIKSGPAAATKTLTVARNGRTIAGLAEDLTVTTNNIEFTLVYDGGTWRL